MEGHDEFERILRSRYIPEMRSNLPERIIAASLRVDQPKVNAFVSWFSDFLDGFAIPRPALAMGVALFIGVMIGMAPSSNSEDSDFLMQMQVQADLGDML